MIYSLIQFSVVRSTLACSVRRSSKSGHPRLVKNWDSTCVQLVGKIILLSLEILHHLLIVFGSILICTHVIFVGLFEAFKICIFLCLTSHLDSSLLLSHFLCLDLVLPDLLLILSLLLRSDSGKLVFGGLCICLFHFLGFLGHIDRCGNPDAAARLKATLASKEDESMLIKQCPGEGLAKTGEKKQLNSKNKL